MGKVRKERTKLHATAPTGKAAAAAAAAAAGVAESEEAAVDAPSALKFDSSGVSSQQVWRVLYHPFPTLAELNHSISNKRQL